MGLPNFGKRRVRKAALSIRKTGSGLDEKLAFEPVAFWPGDEIFLVVKGVVVDVAHPAENRKKPGQDDLIRVHIADAVEVALVAEAEAEPFLKRADDQLAEFRRQQVMDQEAAEGKVPLPFDGDEFDEVIRAHNAGEHKTLVEDCPGCQAEVDAENEGD